MCVLFVALLSGHVYKYSRWHWQQLTYSPAIVMGSEEIKSPSIPLKPLITERGLKKLPQDRSSSRGDNSKELTPAGGVDRNRAEVSYEQGVKLFFISCKQIMVGVCVLAVWLQGARALYCCSKLAFILAVYMSIHISHFARERTAVFLADDDDYVIMYYVGKVYPCIVVGKHATNKCFIHFALNTCELGGIECV